MELLFYFAFLAILTTVVINALLAMTNAFRETTVITEFTQAGDIMERISREIKQATSISSISTNSLVLNSTDSSGNTETVTFSLSNPSGDSDVQIAVVGGNNPVSGNLNTPRIKIPVGGLTFTKITDTKGVGVRVTMSVKATNDPKGRIINFFDTLVLRGSYAPAS